MPKKIPHMKTVRSQSGFTLFEMVITMTVMSILAAPFIYQKVQQFEEDRIEIAVAEINDLFQSAQNYAAEQDGDWPSETDNCASAISELENENYLVGFLVESTFGTDLITSCTTSTGKRFLITIDAITSGNAEQLDGYLPSSTVTGSLVTVSVPMPAAIPALDHLLPLDGSRKMTGSLDMDDNDILNANQVETETILLKFTVTKGDSCTNNGKVARDNEGRVLSCVNGIWSGAAGTPENMVAFFNANTCPDGWSESNGTNGTRDLRGEFVRGLDRGRGVDPGRTLGSGQLDQMQRIVGEVRSSDPQGWMGSASGAFTSTGSVRRTGGISHGHNNRRTLRFDSRNSPNARVSASNSGETRARNVALLACQKQP